MDIDQMLEAFAKKLAPLIAAELKKTEKADRAPVKLKEAAKLTGKSESHLRNEVNAGRIRRVPGTAKILVPWPEIERLRAGELVSKIR